MKRVLTAAVLVPLVLLVVFRAPLWLFALVVAGVAILALHEYLEISKGYGVEPLSKLAYALTLLLIFNAYAVSDDALLPRYPWLSALPRPWVLLSGLAIVFGIPVLFRRDMKMALAASGISAFALPYLALPFALLILFRHDPLEGVFLIFTFFSVWMGDTAAYYTGRAFGRHKLAPVVSPKKTWEGAVASVFASVGVAVLVFHFAEPLSRLFTKPKVSFYTPIGSSPTLPVLQRVILGAGVNVAAQLGDLFESALKRGAQIKDSGSLLPGHGGILDRIDALLFAVPFVWYYANFQAYFS